MKYGGFWIRFSAMVLDLLFVTLIVTAIFLLLTTTALVTDFIALKKLAAALGQGGQLGVQVEVVTPRWGDYILFMAIALYYVYFTATYQQATPGKRIVGLKVTCINGKRLRFIRSFCRFIAYFACLIPFVIATHYWMTITHYIRASILEGFIVGFIPGSYILAAITPKKRALHDYITGTQVIRMD